MLTDERVRELAVGLLIFFKIQNNDRNLESACWSLRTACKEAVKAERQEVEFDISKIIRDIQSQYSLTGIKEHDKGNVDFTGLNNANATAVAGVLGAVEKWLRARSEEEEK